MTTDHYKRVQLFMQKAEQDTPDRPTPLTDEQRLLRARLIYEEAMETIMDGLGIGITYHLDEGTVSPSFYVDGDMNDIETIDGCCDLSVVTIGTLIAMGVPDEPFLQEVDHNNLAKFGFGSYRDEHGKWIKPPDHNPPRIEEILEVVKVEADEKST